MRKQALVTGAAGFIGSHLCERLIDDGWKVIGIDCFSSYYSRALKEANLSVLRSKPDFSLIEDHILNVPFDNYLKDIDVVFHQAGEPGVRNSWGENFKIYIENNILATQYLLEYVKKYQIKKFIYASSSSVYGNSDLLPMKESDLPKPYSPYGLTKLAAEHLCQLYYENNGVPVICLRYFTVYGPRQRPEMAISSFIQQIMSSQPINIYGDGTQRRDFTYVNDIVTANLLAAASPIEGEIFNVGSGHPVELIEVIRMLEKIIGKCAKLNFSIKQKGDVNDTFADLSKITKILQFKPSFNFETGLYNQVEYTKKL
jgi:UDP-glucose 4-epimerase